MKLIELNIQNFRSLFDLSGIPIRSQTILTGPNDCGKTACLDALAFLLGDKLLENSDISDIDNIESSTVDEGQEISVEGKFELSPSETLSLQLPSPLHIRRRYLTDGSTFLEAMLRVPERTDLRDIEALGIDALRALGQEFGLEPSGRANAKASWTAPLYEYCESVPLIDDWAPASSQIIAAMPEILYFRGDSVESPEVVVKSILSAKLREHTKNETTRKKIEELEEDFSEQLKRDAEKLRALVVERCELDDLTLTPRIQFKPSVGSIEMRTSTNGQKEVPLTATGAGRSRRISLALWEGTQEVLAGEEQEPEPDGERDQLHDIVIVYDEPDTHLDYSHQRRIMGMIRESSLKSHSTVIVATHSLNLIDGVDIQDIVHLDTRGGRAEIQSLTAHENDKEVRRFMSNMAISLGFRNSVLLHERCFVAVEGVTEYAAFPVLFRIAMGYPIQSAGIALWSCGGNDGALQFAKFLKEHKRTVVFVVDADSKRDKARFFNDDRLSRYGFNTKDCVYVGTNELEDIFTGEHWAKVADDHWPRADGTSWRAEEIDALRAKPKFSESLKNLISMQSEQRIRKEELVSVSAQSITDPSEVPAALKEVFEKLVTIAQDAGPHHWESDL